MHAVKGAGRLIAGRYRLQRPIGRGAMGIVWQGHDELLHRDVAVKEVQLTALAMPADEEAGYQRTLREARTAARLSHPGVVTVFDVVEEDGSPWIVMELIGGRSLDQVIAEDGPLPPQHAAELGTSLLGALAAAHAAGVLHRDVKPGNVLVTAGGRAVLTDFGIATFEEDPGLTQAGMVVGTPGFTAPERVRGHGATPASDLWSLGATLYAAVEGRGPFDRAGGPAAISAGVAAEDAPRAPSAGPLGPVIDALLRRDPQTRPDAVAAATLLTQAGLAAGTGPAPLLTSGWGTSGPADHPGPDDATAALPANPAAGRPGRAPTFLDPPVFAELAMPETAGPAMAGDLAGAGLPEFLDPPDAWPPGPSGPAAQGRAGDLPPGPAGAWAQASPAAGTQAPGGARTHTPGGAGTPGPAGAGTPGPAADWAHGQPGPKVRRPPGSGEQPPPGAGWHGSPGYWAAGPPDAGAPGPPGAQPPGGAGQFPPRAGTARAGSSAAGPGAARPLPPGGRHGPWSRYWRVATVSAGIAAIVAAALLGFNLYSHTLTTGNPDRQGAPGAAAAGAAAAGTSSAGTSGAASAGRSPASSRPGSAAGVPSGRGGAASQSSAHSGVTAGSGGGAAGGSATGGGATSPALPPGYQWHTVTAATLGSTAGFGIAAPGGWQLRTAGQAAFLEPAAGRAFLEVSLSPFTYSGPVAQARYQQATALASREYPGYRVVAIQPGEFAGAAAAGWRFSWKPAAAARTTVLAILVTLPTSAGSQPYELSVSAPSAYFAAARVVFDKALSTFRPLPPG